MGLVLPEPNLSIGGGGTTKKLRCLLLETVRIRTKIGNKIRDRKIPSTANKSTPHIRAALFEKNVVRGKKVGSWGSEKCKASKKPVARKRTDKKS